MPPRSDSARRTEASGKGRLLRFVPEERWIHHATALLMLVCIVTAACLYVDPLAQLVGQRRLVTVVHEWAGIALPAPLLLGLGSRALRADLKRLNRLDDHDRRWLRAARRGRHRSGVPSGKFNAGQKLYAAWTAGAVLVMVGTGLLLWFPELVSVSMRTGATFVHDWLALAVGIVVAAHIWKAAGDAEARHGIWHGTVSRTWADQEHRLWLKEFDDEPGPGDTRSGGAQAPRKGRGELRDQPPPARR